MISHIEIVFDRLEAALEASMKRYAEWWFALLLAVVLGCSREVPIRATQLGTASKRTSAPDIASAERPGLGTAFGESRPSRAKSVKFVRGGSAPVAVATLWYNDPDGIRAMASTAGNRQEEALVATVLDGMVAVHLEGENGRILPGVVAGGRSYVIGHAEQRYVIVVENRSEHRLEAVASVDGLDVIDGRPAAVSKRGYVVKPNRSIRITGYRTSADTVAAFRFSSVRGAYSSRSGQGDRNVGVIGVALFNESGDNLSVRAVDGRQDEAAGSRGGSEQ